MDGSLDRSSILLGSTRKKRNSDTKGLRFLLFCGIITIVIKKGVHL